MVRPVQENSFIKILGGKINKLKIINEKNLNDEIIGEILNIDCLIIDNFKNKTDEKLLYSILNQSKQYDKSIVINSTISLKEINFKLNNLKSIMNIFIFICIELPT